MSAILARISEMTAADFILIILAGLEVAVGILTLFVAIAAIWGYTAIHKGARDTAQKMAQSIANKVARETREKMDEFLKHDAPKLIQDKIDAATRGKGGLNQSIEKPTTGDIIDKDSDPDKKETDHA